MRQLCQMGFDCPYHHKGEGEEQCTYPFLRPKDDQVYPAPGSWSCELLGSYSDLERVLTAYEGSGEVRELVDKEYERLEKERIDEVMRLHDELFSQKKEGEDRMIWEDVMGEQLTYDGSEECLSMLRDRDLFISNDGHLCEMCSLTACRDYGAISIGDKILIAGDFREIYVSRKGVKE